MRFLPAAFVLLVWLLGISLFLAPRSAMAAGDISCDIATNPANPEANRICLTVCCGRGFCPPLLPGGCPIMDVKLEVLNAQRTALMAEWKDLQQLATKQTLSATLLGGVGVDPITMMEEGINQLEQESAQSVATTTEYNCLDRPAFLKKNGILPQREGEPNSAYNKRAMAYTVSQTVLPRMGITTPDQRTQITNNQRACFKEHAEKQQALGLVAIDILEVYRDRLFQYANLIPNVVALPCFDPEGQKPSMELMVQRLLNGQPMIEMPVCLREEMRILSMLERDTQLLNSYRAQLDAMQAMGRVWGNLLGKRNPINPK
jgi:hypothetical protein